MAEGALIGPVWYLAGSSYPADHAVGAALLPRLAARGWPARPWESLLDGRGDQAAWQDTEARLALLDATAPQDRSGLVLIGRSSGAVAATRFAARNRIAAVVCLGYPFRHPACWLEPERFAHLRTLATPTLIVQGPTDPYGGLDVPETYPLSPAIRLSFRPVGHAFALDDAQWDAVAAEIAAFLCNRDRVVEHHGLAFDETFYRTCHPDIAAAIDAGDIASGADHFRAHGRAEGRRFRLLPAVEMG